MWAMLPERERNDNLFMTREKNQLLTKNFLEKKHRKASFFIMNFRNLFFFEEDVSKNIKKNSVKLQVSHQ